MRARVAPSLKERVRFWWIRNGQGVGLVIGAAIIAPVAFLIFPRGPTLAHDGVVTGFRSVSTDTGTEVYASVEVAGHPTLVLMPPGHDCAVGGAIALSGTRFALGPRYVVKERGCDASAGR